MAHSAKTVSIRHLHAAVKTALAAARKEHSNLKFDAATPLSGGAVLPIYVRFPWICGLPAFPWPEGELGDLAAFNVTFVNSLAGNKDISALAAEGKFEPTLYVSGGNAAIGFRPADVSLTE
jgi:hypothetical protein